MRSPQHLQEVYATLALRRRERGEERVGDHGGIGILVQVSGSGVIGLKIARHLWSRRQQGVLSLVELFVAFRQLAIDLAGRYVDVQVHQFFVDQWLCDAVLGVLVELITTEPHPKVPPRVGWQGSDLVGPVGEQIAQSSVTDIVGLDLQVLDDKVLVTILACAFWQAVEWHIDRLVNFQRDGLVSFCGIGAFPASLLLVRRIGMRRVECAQSDVWKFRPSLQSCDLVA